MSKILDLNMAFYISGFEYRLEYLKQLPNKSSMGNFYPDPLIIRKKHREIPFFLTFIINGNITRVWVTDYSPNFFINSISHRPKDNLKYYFILFLDFENQSLENNKKLLLMYIDFQRRYYLDSEILSFYKGNIDFHVQKHLKNLLVNNNIVFCKLDSSKIDVTGFLKHLKQFILKKIDQ